MTPSQPVRGDEVTNPAATPPSLSAPLFISGRDGRMRDAGGKRGGDFLFFYEYKGVCVCNVGLLKSCFPDDVIEMMNKSCITAGKEPWSCFIIGPRSSPSSTKPLGVNSHNGECEWGDKEGCSAAMGCAVGAETCQAAFLLALQPVTTIRSHLLLCFSGFFFVFHP